MAKVLQFSEITPGLAFTEFDFYKDYEESFKKSELGRFHGAPDKPCGVGRADANPKLLLNDT